MLDYLNPHVIRLLVLDESLQSLFARTHAHTLSHPCPILFHFLNPVLVHPQVLDKEVRETVNFRKF